MTQPPAMPGSSRLRNEAKGEESNAVHAPEVLLGPFNSTLCECMPSLDDKGAAVASESLCSTSCHEPAPCGAPPSCLVDLHLLVGSSLLSWRKMACSPAFLSSQSRLVRLQSAAMRLRRCSAPAEAPLVQAPQTRMHVKLSSTKKFCIFFQQLCQLTKFANTSASAKGCSA